MMLARVVCATKRWHSLPGRGYKALYSTAVKSFGQFEVRSTPIFEDNYTYAVVNKRNNTCALVDPADPDIAQEAVRDCEIREIWTTHKHLDHCAGNAEIASSNADVEVYGSAMEKVAGQTQDVEGGSVFKSVVAGDVHVLHTPCHTKGHVCYHLPRSSDNTLFVGGCGRFFEGSAEDMLMSLASLAKLDPSTSVYCGHEYTVSNLKFAKAFESNNDIEVALERALRMRAEGIQTVPTTIEEELKSNLFLMVASRVGGDEDVGDLIQRMFEVRFAKDNFKG